MVSKHSSVKEMIIWWERKRLIYNILILGLSIFSMYSYWDYPMRHIKGSQQIILNSTVFIIVANLFYTLSWISGAFVYYATNKTLISDRKKRWILFILGTIFSLFWTNLNFVIEFDVLFAD
jgi:hypothetical protein